MRTCVLFEPRGSMDSFEAIVLPPIDKRAEFSLIFMNTLGYIYVWTCNDWGCGGAFETGIYPDGGARDRDIV